MNRTRLGSVVKDYKSIVIFAVAAIAASVLSGGKTLSTANLQNLMTQVSIQGIVGFGMTFALICGEFDLAVGSIYTLSGIVFAKVLQTAGFLPAVLAALLVGCLLGLTDGLVVNKMGVDAFIATLSTSYIYKGIALLVSDGKPTSVSNNATALALGKFRLFGLPVYTYIFLLVGLISMYILRKTRLGRNIYATGDNYEVAKNSGINGSFHKITAFVLCGLSSALAGILLTIRLQSATSIAGDDLNLVVIGAVIIGGTSPSGGVGSALKSFIGLMIFGVLINTMDVLGIAGYYQQVVRGLVTVLVIGSTSYASYRKVSAL